MKYYKYRFSVMLIAISLCSTTFAELKESNFTTGGESSKLEYSFAFLGDLHFDRLGHHDMDWVKETHPGDIRQIKNYSQVTEQNSQGLLEAVFNSLKNQNIPTFAIIQAGDFVEGLCGSYELQVLQFKEAIAFVEPLTPSVPFLITKGNHDITGPGAAKAYSDIIVPWLGKQLGTTMSGASYYVKHKSDLFIFFDAYRHDLNWLDEVLDRHPARHVFFIIHKPVVPYNARSQWHIFSKDKEQFQREKLLSLLGKYHVIVLSGHLHHYSVLRRKTDGGVFVQLAMNGVIDIDERKVKLLEGVDKYTPELVDLEANFNTKTKHTRRELLKKEKPFIDYFELAETPCYSLIKVSDNYIDVDVRLRSSQSTWRRLQIAKSTLNITNTGYNLTNKFTSKKRSNGKRNDNK